MNLHAFTQKDNDIILSHPEYLSNEDWIEFCGLIRKLGYDFTDPETCKLRFTRLANNTNGFILNPDQANAVRYATGLAIEPEADYHLIDEINRHLSNSFGTTDDCTLAGYILTNGTMLNLSYEGYQRDIDHRDITPSLEEIDGVILPENELGGNSAGMIWFMNQGAIRISPNNINLHRPPTIAQKRTLNYFVRYFQGDIYLDLGTYSGSTAASKVFPIGTFGSEIVDTIDTFFRTGFLPEELDVIEGNPYD